MTREEIQRAYLNLATRRGDLAFQESALKAQIANVALAIAQLEEENTLLQKTARELVPAVQEGTTDAVAAPTPND